MPLLINLRHLEKDDLQVQGELPVEDLELGIEDEVIRVTKPLLYDFEAQRLDHSILVHGTLRLMLECVCVRCLKTFSHEVRLENWTRHLALEGEEKVPVNGDFVDLTPFLREDILLEFPQHPLCDTNCRGLTTNQSRAKKASDPAKSKEESSAWAELDKLKF